MNKDRIEDAFSAGVWIIFGMVLYFLGSFISSTYYKASGMAMVVSLIPITIGFFLLPQAILPKSRIYEYLGCIISAILFFMFLDNTHMLSSWFIFSHGSFYGVPNILIIEVIASLIYLYIAIKFITDDFN